DGIRDRNVTGVQTCALPIYGWFFLLPVTCGNGTRARRLCTPRATGGPVRLPVGGDAKDQRWIHTGYQQRGLHLPSSRRRCWYGGALEAGRAGSRAGTALRPDAGAAYVRGSARGDLG